MFDIYEHYGTLGLRLIHQRMLTFFEFPSVTPFELRRELNFMNAMSAECLIVLAMEAL